MEKGSFAFKNMVCHTDTNLPETSLLFHGMTCQDQSSGDLVVITHNYNSSLWSSCEDLTAVQPASKQPPITSYPCKRHYCHQKHLLLSPSVAGSIGAVFDQMANLATHATPSVIGRLAVSEQLNVKEVILQRDQFQYPFHCVNCNAR